jgi:radical SAM superfamily enzyme YgiQ (UPF0313 family)
MKLVLIQPPVQDFYDTPLRLQPLGLAYLKAAVKKYLPHWEVVIKDFHQGRGRRTMAWPSDLAYLREYYPWPDRSPFSLFHLYYHFGASFEAIARETALEKPDVVGISSLFSPYYREVLQCVEAIRGAIDCPIVLGGSHVSAVPDLMLRHPGVDWVIRGEGEDPLVALLRAFEKGRGYDHIPGLGFKEGGRLILNPPGKPSSLEDLPFPDYTDLDRGPYLFEKRPLCFIMASRGCPHRCTFCSVHRTFPGYRRRSVKSVLSEMIRRFEEGYRVFDFEDDNLTYDEAAMGTLCEAISRTFSPGTIECLAMNGISYQSLTPGLLLAMKKAGFTHLNLSLVSADEAVRKETGRPPGTDRYGEVVQAAFGLQFKIVSYQILGLPGESLDSMIRTLRFNARLPVLLGASPFYATPGTVLARKLPEATETDLFKARLTALAVESETCRREDLYTLFLATRILNFLKGLTVHGKAVPLEEALGTARNRDKRTASGVDLLERLFTEGRLYAATREGPKPLPRFRGNLFFTLLKDLDHIQTCEGKIIEIPPRLTHFAAE